MTLTSEQFARLTLEEAKAGLDSGDFAAGGLCAAAAQRMDAFEPKVNAVITRASPAAGIPVIVEDGIMTKGLRTTCGSRILDNFIPPYNATVVSRLLAHGLAVAAKGNMDEFGLGRSGGDSAFGPTANPWDASKSPGGSASGCAAAVAYGGAPAAIAGGSGGAIRLPAAYCGLVGMKPTYGRVPRYGVSSVGSSLDSAGPLTRTVADNALLLDILSGHDPLDSTSLPMPADAKPCRAAVGAGVQGLRLGIDPTMAERGNLPPALAAAYKDMQELLRQNGMNAVEVSLPYFDAAVAAYTVLTLCEGSTNLSRFDGVRYGHRQPAADVWGMYTETRAKGFGDEAKRRMMLGSRLLSSDCYDAYYLQAARVRRMIADGMGKLFETVDAILLPVSPFAAPERGKEPAAPASLSGDMYCVPSCLAGLPALAFPAGQADGLPVGVQAVGRHFAEDILYRIAGVAEQNIRLADAPWTKV